MSDTNDNTAADQASLAVAQESLATAQAKLDAEKAEHEDNVANLAAAQGELETAQAKLTADQAALAEAQVSQSTPQPVSGVPAANAAETVAVQAAAMDHPLEVTDAIEAKATFWGGDVGADVRTLLGRLKNMMGFHAAATVANTPSAQSTLTQAPTTGATPPTDAAGNTGTAT
jgi:multidrug efflux pump subunit AcrA (membrane-fusion protein)